MSERLGAVDLWIPVLGLHSYLSIGARIYLWCMYASLRLSLKSVRRWKAGIDGSGPLPQFTQTYHASPLS